MMPVYTARWGFYAMIEIIKSGFEENTYVLVDDGEAVIVDPGSNAEEALDFIEKKGATLKAYWLTHGHFDHISGLGACLKRIDAPVYIHEAERHKLFDGSANLSVYMGDDYALSDAAKVRSIVHDDALTLGDATWCVVHTPGHAEGAVCLHQDGVLLSGDTLFKGGVGRTDLPGGDPGALESSLHYLIETFRGDTSVYPGHGPPTTIAEEKRHNPFL